MFRYYLVSVCFVFIMLIIAQIKGIRDITLIEWLAVIPFTWIVGLPIAFLYCFLIPEHPIRRFRRWLRKQQRFIAKIEREQEEIRKKKRESQNNNLHS